MKMFRLWLAALLAGSLAACGDPEDCTLGSGDEDGDGAADCADSDCAAEPACGAEVCDNGVDDNGNGAVDCQEISCAAAINCAPETDCADGIDNDSDSDIDCEDSDCNDAQGCFEAVCVDGADDDGDGLIDCADPDCDANPLCAPELDCDNGLDDDNDGLTDCEDSNCADSCCGNGNVELNLNEECDDGNNTPGDCCDAACQSEGCAIEVEPNNSIATSNGPLFLPSFITASISPATDADFFEVNLPVGGTLVASTSDADGIDSCDGLTTTLTLFNAAGQQLAFDDNSGPSQCSRIVKTDLPAGDFFVRAQENGTNAEIGTYLVHVSFNFCGDNVQLEGVEECDDGNTDNGDGCNSECLLEPECGNGLLQSPPELCDDGNLANGDGPANTDNCDSNCTPPRCGNGVVAFDQADNTEECDDGNTASGDGCDANCKTTRCGNDVVFAPETCDNNNLNGQSCVTLGFASGTLSCNAPGGGDECTFNTSGCVASICGNNITETGEQCDDGNTTPGDGCNASCQLEFFDEVEPNNDPGTATPLAGSLATARGAINPAADLDFYAITLTTRSDLRIETFDGTDPIGTCVGVDTIVQLRAPDGTTILVTDDNDAGNAANNCSLISPVAPTNDAGARNLAPGTYFIRVEDKGNNSVINAYRARIEVLAACGDGITEGSEVCDDGNTTNGDGCAADCRSNEGCGNSIIDLTAAIPEQCDDGNTTDGDCCSSACQREAGCEIEPNGNSTEAVTQGPITAPFTRKGNIIPTADKDFYAIVLPAAADLKIQTFDGTGASCTGLTTTIKLFAPNGSTQLATNTTACGSLDSVTTAALRNLAAGTYFLSVEETGNNAQIGVYTAAVSLNALCGDGQTTGTETCDDGNAVPGDGCSELCRVEGCGNGLLDVGEGCDDGNTNAGDCCSSTCQVEPGCEAEPNGTAAQASGPFSVPSVPRGAINPGSDLDFLAVTISATTDLRAQTSTSATVADTCASTDTILTLFAPDGTTILVTDDNDAGNAANNCSLINSTADAGARRLAPGTYFLKVEDKGNNSAIPTYFVHLTANAVCGDNTVAGAEVCDDGNLVNGDGCEANCTATPVCGDGTVNQAGEECDDGNLNNNDGCSAGCLIEECGDGVQQTSEGCDDGNLANGDGCRDNCTLELCGDDILDPQEECDDGNTVNGDGCNSVCDFERTFEIEPNGSIAQAIVTGINLLTDQLFLGGITSVGDKDFVRLTLTQTTTLHLETFDDLLNSCVGIDTELSVFSDAGVKLASADDGGIAGCSALDLVLPAGTYFIRVNDFDDDDVIPAYSLLIDLF